MLNLYDKNGLMFWSEEEIKLRKIFENYFKEYIHLSLRQQNAAFQIMQCEAPILTPSIFLSPEYLKNDGYFEVQDTDLALRPETTMGSFAFAKHIMSGYYKIKQKPPLIIWQHGKSFRKEQDQPTKHMRLKEFYQLEFQIIYAESTLNDYSAALYNDINIAFNKIGLNCRVEKSDRLPQYSEETIDIIENNMNLELCSMSKRMDFTGYKVIEIAIGTDRCIYSFKEKNI